MATISSDTLSDDMTLDAGHVKPSRVGSILPEHLHKYLVTDFLLEEGSYPGRY